MEKKELDIYNKMVREKYKFYTMWRVMAIVFMCFTVLFAFLYFASGSVVTTEENTTTNNNDIQVVNDGGGNKNFVTVNN